MKMSIKDIIKQKNSTYMPSFALNHIDKMNAYVYENKYIKLTILAFSKDTYTFKKIYNYCFQTYKMLEAMSNKTLKFQLKMLLICNPEKRKFPKIKGDSIKPDNINGGVCYMLDTDFQIIVSRYEDCVKVLVHEMVHAFDIDGKNKFTRSPIENEFARKFNIKFTTHIGWFESVTETLAFHILCKLKYYNPNELTKRLYQIAYSYHSHFDNTDSFNEETHAFMYIIGRLAFWTGLECDPELMTLVLQSNVTVDKVLDMLSIRVPVVLERLSKNKEGLKFVNSMKIDISKVLNRSR